MPHLTNDEIKAIVADDASELPEEYNEFLEYTENTMRGIYATLLFAVLSPFHAVFVAFAIISLVYAAYYGSKGSFRVIG